MALYCTVLNLGGSIHNLGYLNGVALLEGNPIQIPQVMYTAA